MMDHLPECFWPDTPERAVCICDRLRACEQRVRSEWALKVVDAKQEGFVEGIKEGRRRTSSETKTEMKQSYQEGIAVGRAAGLDAARETVLAYADDTDKHVGTFGCYPENGDRCDITVALRVAAQKIDALREEQK